MKEKERDQKMIKWITWKKLSDKQPRATDRVNQVT
jgi:hypothetical protein